MLQVRERPAFDVIEQAHMYRLAADFQGQQVCTIVRRDHPWHLHLGMFSQMPEPGMLGLQLQRRIIATADFQDELPSVTVNAIVEVLLAAEGLQPAAQPIMPFEQLQGLRHRHLRSGQTGAMNQRGERHTTTPEILLGAYIATAGDDTQPPRRADCARKPRHNAPVPTGVRCS